jgi:hypothetical protein
MSERKLGREVVRGKPRPAIRRLCGHAKNVRIGDPREFRTMGECATGKTNKMVAGREYGEHCGRVLSNSCVRTTVDRTGSGDRMEIWEIQNIPDILLSRTKRFSEEVEI